MNSYRVKFINDLVDSSGHNFHCCQGSVEIRAAKSRERAIKAAKHRFARRQAVPHWSVRAHLIEVEEIAPPPEPQAMPAALRV